MAEAFFRRSVSRGAEMFGDTADNMTGIVVYLNTKGAMSTYTSKGPMGIQGEEVSSLFSV